MRANKHIALLWACLSLFLLKNQLAAQSADQASSKIVQDWNALFLDIERYAPGFRPCAAATAAGYMGLSFYETVVPGMPGYQSQARLFSGLTVPVAPTGAINWAAATNESYAFLMSKFFGYLAVTQPANFQKIATLRQNWHNQLALATPAAAVSAGESRGQAVAQAVWNWFETDPTAKNAWLVAQPAAYIPPAGAGLWTETPPDESKALYPFYGNARTFALPEAEKTGIPPPAFSETPGSIWHTQAMEVFTDVNDIRAGGPVGYEKQWRAEFWSDDLLNLTFAPPLRLLADANQLAADESLNLADAALLYGKLGLAMHDAAVSLWKSKYIYNIERPVTYIQRVIPGAANWLPALDNPLTNVAGLTPPFPAYPSGHSGFGGVLDGVMTDFFGQNFSFIDSCHAGRTEFNGTPRSFSSFKEMGEENAFSRIPLGVHYRFDCDEGLRMGRNAARHVLDMPWQSPDCSLVQITPGAGQIEVRGLNSPIVLVQMFNAAWQKVFDFTGAPGMSSTRKATGLQPGNYYVKVNLLTSGWQQICEKNGYFTVTSGGGGGQTGVLTFNQPADISVNAAAGQTSATASFSTPSASSTCPTGAVSVVQTSGPASGATFPVGQTSVCFKATDGCGNSQTRCFTVTVNPAVQPAAGCAGITFTPGTGQIVVGGLTAPIVMVQAFNSNWQPAYNFNGNAPGTRTISGLAAGQYFVKVDFFTANWVPICNKESYVTVGNSGGGGNPTPGADVEVSILGDKTTVAQWGTVNYSIKIKNNGTANLASATVKIGGCAGGVFQKFEQAFGLVFAATPAAPTNGNFNFVLQEWAVTNLAAGQSATLNISLFALTNAEKKVVAFAKAQSPAETDSQTSANPPANCTPTQDDEAVWTVNSGQNGQGVTPQSNGAEAAEITDFSIFPNPTAGFCAVDLNGFLGEKLAISVSDIFGKNVYFEKTDALKTPQLDLNLSDETAGVYFIKIEPEGKRAITKRLIISKL